ncbi:MAG: PAS domain-containing protein, partial [Planctomycetota bacterium]|nr:PAS domain-containing protein [Planctomycetota bacterium]
MRDLLANVDLVRFALNVGRVGVYLQDYVSNEHVWSPLAYEIFGVSPNFEVSAESLLQIILSEDIPHVLRQVNAAHTPDSSVTDYRLQFRVRGEDGEVRHIEAHALLERD